MDYRRNYEEYWKAIGKIDPTADSSLSEIEENYDKLFREAFDDSRIEEYRSFYGENTRFSISCEFMRVYDALAVHDFDSAARFIGAGCSAGSNYPPAEDARKFAERLFEQAKRNDCAGECIKLSFWQLFAAALGHDTIDLMLKHYSIILRSPDVLKNSMRSENYWQIPGRLGYVSSRIGDYCRENPEYKDIYADGLKQLKLELAERKKCERTAHRELRDIETGRTESQESKSSGGVRGLIESLGDIIKRRGNGDGGDQ